MDAIHLDLLRGVYRNLKNCNDKDLISSIREEGYFESGVGSSQRYHFLDSLLTDDEGIDIFDKFLSYMKIRYGFVLKFRGRELSTKRAIFQYEHSVIFFSDEEALNDAPYFERVSPEKLESSILESIFGHEGKGYAVDDSYDYNEANYRYKYGSIQGYFSSPESEIDVGVYRYNGEYHYRIPVSYITIQSHTDKPLRGDPIVYNYGSVKLYSEGANGSIVPKSAYSLIGFKKFSSDDCILFNPEVIGDFVNVISMYNNDTPQLAMSGDFNYNMVKEFCPVVGDNSKWSKAKDLDRSSSSRILSVLKKYTDDADVFRLFSDSDGDSVLGIVDLYGNPDDADLVATPDEVNGLLDIIFDVFIGIDLKEVYFVVGSGNCNKLIARLNSDGEYTVTIY